MLASHGRVPMQSRAEHFDVLNLDEDDRRVAGELPIRLTSTVETILASLAPYAKWIEQVSFERDPDARS